MKNSFEEINLKVRDIDSIKRDFYSLFEKMVLREKHNFSGIGLVVYDSALFDNLNSFSLRPSVNIPPFLSLRDNNTLDFLVDASSIDSPIHDGFMFFNERGYLTHVSQYFHPPPVPGVKPNTKYGTRYHAAVFGSYIKGVILAGGITSGNHHYVFENGKLIEGDS